ncbi:MAG: glycosyltransferase family 39 protein, partial [Chloroflexota bacterium]|nr:glycosyltransferase family 39 protein [Chloroflexota bacterium]
MERIQRIAKERETSIALNLAILLAFALRVYRLGDKNIWWDEGLAIWAVRKGLVSVTLWTAGDVHPPLYFWLLKPWVRLVGESEFAARFLSVIWGILAVALIYPLAKRLINQEVGALATCLLATSRFHIWWSQEMRMYILAAFLIFLSLYLFTRLEGGERKMWLCYVLATTAALYALYLAALVILIESLLVLATKRSRSFLLKWICSQAAILLLFAPWLYLALTHARTWSVSAPFSFGKFLRLYWLVLPLGISTHIERYTWLALAFFVISTAGLIFLFLTKRREAGLLLLLCLALPPLAIHFISLPRGFFYSPQVEARYFLPFAPPFYILLACSVVLLKKRSNLTAAMVLVFILASFGWALREHYGGRYTRDEFQTATRVISADARPDDAVLLVSGNRYPVFLYYYNREFEGQEKPAFYALPRHSSQIAEENVASELEGIASSHPRLWLALADAPMQDPQGLVEKWLDERYAKPISIALYHNELHLYTTEPAEPEVSNLNPQHPLNVQLGENELLGYDLPTTEYRPGDTAHLGLYWRVGEGGQVGVDLVDEKGQMLERRELALEGNKGQIRRYQLDFTVFDRTPAGSYHFEVHSLGAPYEKIPLGRLMVTCTKPLPKADTISHPMEVELGEGIVFLGYALSPEGKVKGSDVLEVDLYWKARRKVERNYTVFMHLLG